MTLDASRETETQNQPTCRFCGGKFDLGYHYMCRTCGATYCYIHMSKHMRAHSSDRAKGRPSIPPDAGEPANRPEMLVLTTGTDGIELIRT
jgi:hypothetical protein